MSTEQEIPKEITESIRHDLGDKGKHIICKLVKVEQKNEKLEDRILVLSVCRAYVYTFPAKPPAKKEPLDFHFLDIQSFESRKPLQLRIGVGDKSHVYLMTQIGDADDVISHIAVSLKKYFPTTPFEKFVKVRTLEPANRHDKIKETLDRQVTVEETPCGGFSNMYACMCDYHNMPYREEVAWDIDTIYVSQNNKDMCLNDFDHLEARDLVPVISALRYNQWFNKISAKDVKLTTEASRQIAKVLMKNPNIQELHLENTSIHRWDFGQELATALQVPSSLHVLNLKGNHIDDRGVQHLCGVIPKLAIGLTELNLSNTKISTKGVSNLGTNLAAGKAKKTLKKLYLADNSLKGEEFSPLLTFLSHSNVVSHLDLSNCEVAMDCLFPALSQGCLHTLTHLNLSRNLLTNRKGKDIFIPQAMKEYFATSTALKYVNLSGNKLPPQFLKDVLLGIASNGAIKDLELDLSNNELKSEGSRVLENCIARVHGIASLDISGNGLEADLASVVDWIRTNRHIKKLSIGNNLHSVRQNKKQLNKVLDTIVKLLQEDEGTLEWFSLADCKLKTYTASVLDAVGSNTVLTYLDISGNGMGDAGTRSLAKALQLNTKLKTVKLDRNDIGVNGLQDLANALERNHTLESMPTPVNDAGIAWRANPEKTDAAISKIEELLMRNHNSAQYDAEVIDQAYRTQQSFHTTTSQQVVQKLTADVQQAADHLADCEDEAVRTDVSEALKYVEDGHSSKQMLNKMYLAPRESTQSLIDIKMNELKDKLTSCVKEQLEKSVKEMLQCGEELCPNVVKEDLKSGIQETAYQKSRMSESYVSEWLEQKAGAAIANKASELHLAAATAVCNKITDELLDCLANYRKKLNVHLSNIAQTKNKNGKVELKVMDETEDKTLKENDTTSLRKRFSVRPKSVYIKDIESSRVSLVSLTEEPQSVRPMRHHQYEEINIIPSSDDNNGVSKEENGLSSSSPSLDLISTDSEMNSGEDTPVPTPQPPPGPSVTVLGDLPPVTHTTLTSVTSGRPKKPKRVRPTRPVLMTTEETENKVNSVPNDETDGNKTEDIDVTQGVENFFGTTTVVDPMAFKPATPVTESSKRPQSSIDDETSKTKKEKHKEKKTKKSKDKEKETEKPNPEKKTTKKDKNDDTEKKGKKSLFGFISSLKQGNREKSPSSKKSDRSSVGELDKKKLKQKQKSQEDLTLYEDVNPPDQEQAEEIVKTSDNKATRESKIDISKDSVKAEPEEVVKEMEEEEPAVVAPPKKPKFMGVAMPGMGLAHGDILSAMKQKQDQKLANKEKAEENVKESKVSNQRDSKTQSFVATEQPKQEAKRVESMPPETKPSPVLATPNVPETKISEEAKTSPVPRPRSKVISRQTTDILSKKESTGLHMNVQENASSKPTVPLQQKGNVSPKPRPKSPKVSERPPSTDTTSKRVSAASEQGNISPKPRPKTPKISDQQPAVVSEKGNISPKPRPKSPKISEQLTPIVPPPKEFSDISDKGNVSPKLRPKSNTGSGRLTPPVPPTIEASVETKATTSSIDDKISPTTQPVDPEVTVGGSVTPQTIPKVSDQPPPSGTVPGETNKGVPSTIQPQPPPEQGKETPKELQKSEVDEQTQNVHEKEHVHQTPDVVPQPSNVAQEQPTQPEPKKSSVVETDVIEAKPIPPLPPLPVKPDKAETLPPLPPLPADPPAKERKPSPAAMEHKPPPAMEHKPPPAMERKPSPAAMERKPSPAMEHKPSPAMEHKQDDVKPTTTQQKNTEQHATVQTTPKPDTPSPPSIRKPRSKPPPPLKPKPKPASLKKPAILAKKPVSPPVSPLSPRRRQGKQNVGVDRETQQKMSVKARAKQINTAGDSGSAEITVRSKSFSKTVNDKVDQEIDKPERSKSVGATASTARPSEDLQIPESKKENTVELKNIAEEKEDNKKETDQLTAKNDREKSLNENTEQDGKMESTDGGKSSESFLTENKSEDEGSSELDLEGEGYVLV